MFCAARWTQTHVSLQKDRLALNGALNCVSASPDRRFRPGRVIDQSFGVLFCWTRLLPLERFRFLARSERFAPCSYNYRRRMTSSRWSYRSGNPKRVDQNIRGYRVSYYVLHRYGTERYHFWWPWVNLKGGTWVTQFLWGTPHVCQYRFFDPEQPNSAGNPPSRHAIRRSVTFCNTVVSVTGRAVLLQIRWGMSVPKIIRIEGAISKLLRKWCNFLPHAVYYFNIFVFRI